MMEFTFSTLHRINASNLEASVFYGLGDRSTLESATRYTNADFTKFLNRSADLSIPTDPSFAALANPGAIASSYENSYFAPVTFPVVNYDAAIAPGSPSGSVPEAQPASSANSGTSGLNLLSPNLGSPSELVFIDASLPDYNALLAAMKPYMAVFQLNDQQDGIDQISAVLSGYQNISAIHILSHGNAGTLQLGATTLNSDDLNQYTNQLHGWASHLTDTADILLYGCDVALGMKGEGFIHQLADLTGADIAASNNLTGGTALGGDWTLEVNTGAIATSLFGQATALANYHGILVTNVSASQYTNLKTGVNGFLNVAQTAVDTLVFAQRLPLVGSQLASTTKFFQGIETSLTSAWTTLDAIAPATLNSDNVRAAIATALAPILPSGVTVDESATQLQFNLNLSQAISSSLGFDLGLDAIGLSLTSGGSVATQLGYSLPWKFGIDLTNSQFYVDTSALDELKIDLAVTTPGLNATGKLGFLQVAVVGQDSQNQSTSFTGQFRVDLRDPSGDGRLTAGELTGLTAAQLATPKLQAIAGINLGITTSFGGDTRFPNLKTDLNVNWAFDPTNPSLLPTAAFNNVRMNLGGFFNDFVSPIFAEVQKVLGPVQPVFDVLRTRMPVLSDIGPLRNIYDVDGNGTVTLLEFIGVSSGNTDAVKFIQAIDQVATFASSIPTGVGDLYIPLGNLRLNNSPTTDLRSLTDLSGLNLSNTSLFDDLSVLLPGVDTATRNLVQTFRSNASNANFAGGLAFPLLQNPTTAFGLLLGRDVSVFTLDLPALSTTFNVSQFFPILGPLGVRLSGNFDIQADFNFGYDTAGFRQFANGGFTTPSLIFNGFYISDTANADGTGPDVPEVRLNASVQAAGELNAIVAAAGVGGGLFANVNLDLHDTPPADGKIRLSELEDNFSAHGPLGIFDASGKFTAGLNAYVKVGVDVPFVGFVGWQDSFDIASVTLLEFDTNPATLSPSPVLAQLDPSLGAGVLRLNMGTFAAQRLTGNIIDGDETFKVTRSADGTQILVAAFGIVQAFAANTIQKIYAEGGNGNDVIDIAADVLLPVELWGDFKDPLKTGFGNDKLFAGGGAAILHGGAGDDELTLRAGASQAFGDAGNDKLFGGTGNDTLDGGDGDDTIYGNAGNDSILGGAGDDYLDAGAGDDVVRGGAGSDRIKGGDGNDTLYGDAGNDVIEAGLGNDVAYGGDGNDFILDQGTIFVGAGNASAPLPPGGAVLQNVTLNASGVIVQVQLGAGGGDDLFYGEAGNDALFGQAGSDTLYGNDGNDYVDGGSGNDILYGNDGNDVLSGGDGNDILLGDNGSVDSSGNVTLGTGNGNDSLSGGSGNDTLYGQAGNDFLAGDAGDDLLFGNTGDDILFGDSGQIVNLPGGSVRYESTNPSALGNDTLDGNEGNDIEIGGAGNDLLLGTTGADIALIGDNGRVTLDSSGVLLRAETSDASFGGNDTLLGSTTIINILLGGTGNDSITGSSTGDIILGDNGVVVGADGSSDANAIFSTDPANGGNDTIVGAAGNDTIIGGTGDDNIQGNDGNDLIIGDSGRINRNAAGIMQSMLTLFPTQGGNDTITGDGDADTILGGSGDDSISGGSDNAADVLLGDNGIVYGADGSAFANDILSTDPANGGKDTITGGGGDDIIIGGSGSGETASGEGDRLFGNAGNDIIAGDGAYIVRDASNVVNRIVTPTDTLPGNQDPNLGGNDFIQDTEGYSLILGGAGNDTITTGAGSDYIVGDAGEILLLNGQVLQVRTIAPSATGDDVIDAGNGADTVLGGTGNDSITGGVDNSVDVLLGDNGIVYGADGSTFANDILSTDPTFGGKDTIAGGGGDDIIIGGSGSGEPAVGEGDRLFGDAGNDIIAGDGAFIERTGDAAIELIVTRIVTPTDTLPGNQNPNIGGNDFIQDTEGYSLILGGAGNDTITTGSGSDYIVGDAGEILLLGGQVLKIQTIAPTATGDDIIAAGDGSDTVLGGTGNDLILGGNDAAPNVLLGDNGIVYGVDASLGVNANDIVSTDPTLGGRDSILGGDGDDIIIGGSGGTDAAGVGGDLLLGAAGNDIILGDNGQISRSVTGTVEFITTLFPTLGGDDSLEGNDGRDSLIGGNGNDTIHGNAGDDIILGDNGIFDYVADGMPATLDRVESTDTTLGGNDSITGDDGNDIAFGGFGNDTMQGNVGNDILLGDSGRVLWNSAGIVTRIETTGPSNGGNDNIAGNEGNDTILGGAGNDSITGDAGNDIILGDNGLLNFVVDSDATTLDLVTTTDPTLGGQDTIQGGDGNDLILGGADNDTIQGGLGNDTLLGDNGQITYSTGRIRLIETLNSTVGGDDSVQGNEGDDLILGGFGNDTLEGNAGDDKILGDNGLMDYAYAGDANVAADSDLSTLDFITTTNPTDGGRDRILGGAGNDQILGGTSDDTLYGDDGIDGLSSDWVLLSNGDFNGDGKSDMFWRNTVDQRTLVWLMNGTTIINSNYTYNVDPNWILEGVGDFNGDGKSDILWRNNITGNVVTWLMNGTGYLAAGAVGFLNVPAFWDIRGIGDFNGDGKKDILWRNNNTGQIDVWLMDGLTLLDSGTVGPAAIAAPWNQIAIGDFNGDGKDDLLWRENNDRVDIWLMNGRTMQSATLFPGGIADWQVMGLTDLNGDRRQDIVWRQNGSGRVAVWLMNGAMPLATPLVGPATIDSSWQIVQLGDFNGDGKGDILWRQNGGGVTVWLMNGANVIADQGIDPAVLPAAWQPIGAGDFDGDGRQDIFWRFNNNNNSVTTTGQNNGDLAMWLMAGTTKTADAVYGVVPTTDGTVGRFDDVILGDHGKIYQALPRDRNYFSINTGAADGGGNDLIYGNQGDDFILGQQGDDRIFGGAGEDDIIGGHNVIGGADGNDFIDGGADADVELGDNGRITRRPDGNGGWQRYPAPFPDVIRDVVRFDDVDGVGGNDTVNGGAGDDILYGQRGDDVMDGGAGDDEMYGGLGNDLMYGGAGQDFMLGDVGAILRDYNADGSPRLNANGCLAPRRSAH